MQSCKLGHGMSLLCKRHTMLPRQRLHNGVERGQALPPHGMAHHFGLLAHQPAAAWPFFSFFFFFLGYRGIVHPPSDDEGNERTWFEPEQRPRKRVPKRSVHGKQSPQGALLFKACPLLSGVSAYAADPCGRFVAAQGGLSGGHVTTASVYAPIERQERAPFFQQNLLPTMPIDTPLLLGVDWNCVAENMRSIWT